MAALEDEARAQAIGWAAKAGALERTAELTDPDGDREPAPDLAAAWRLEPDDPARLRVEAAMYREMAQGALEDATLAAELRGALRERNGEE